MELLIVVAILAILMSITMTMIGGAMERARAARAKAEFSEIAKAAQQFVVDNGGTWPPDADRSIPPGIEAYLGPGNWPVGPWEGSVYDWDNFETQTGEKTYQISLRFCPLGEPENCKFPDEPWAKDFDYFSSVYFCMGGQCRAHIHQPADHPGYCINCIQQP